MATAAAAPVRRKVRYNTLDELIADADRAVRAQAPTTGNWSLGQILEHLATANDKTIDGFGFQAPWPVRTIGRYVLKKRLLTNGLKPGFKLGPAASAVLVPGETDTAAALEHLRQSTQRLKSEQKCSAHPFLGPLTVDERNAICLRHAELHMSFVNV
jgi:Protein of unknown function (DUF1569)